ncbi:MAG: polyprenyl synthetase family protein [Acidobacteriota bacterium]
MSDHLPFQATLVQGRERVDATLEDLLPSVSTAPARLHEAMRYAVFAGGKRLRPLLVLLACRACGGPWEDALPIAAAVEMIHTYSLVHDDLPAMDNDSLRRGKPTTHTVYGEAMGILVGDALLTLAFQTLSTWSPDGASGSLGPRVVCALATAAGSTGMIGGQSLDLAAEGIPIDTVELENLHALKTGALIRASVAVGGLIAGADDEAQTALIRYGEDMGLAFQIIDDILDVTGSDASLGKSAGKDQRAGKSTFPAILGLEGSRQKAEALLARGVEHLASLGPRADMLREIARFIVRRNR